MPRQPPDRPPPPKGINGRLHEPPLAVERSRHLLHEAQRLMEAARRNAYEGRATVEQMRRATAKDKPG